MEARDKLGHGRAKCDSHERTDKISRRHRVRLHRPSDPPQGGCAAAHRQGPLHRRLQPSGPDLCRDGALAASACADRPHRHERGEGDEGRAAGADRRGLRGRCAQADSALAGALDELRLEAHRQGRQAGIRRAARAAARRQGALCRRAGGGGGGGDPRAGNGRGRSGRGRIPGTALHRAHRGRAQARPRAAVGRDAGQRAGGHHVRRQSQDRRSVRQGRACGQIEVQHRPRHRGDDGIALVPRRLRQGDWPRHALLRRRRRGEAEGRDGRHSRHSARQGPRPLLRHRRQLRLAQPALCRVRPGGVGGGQAQAAGEIHRDALGGVPHRLSGPRSARRHRGGVRRQGQDPGDALRQHQQCRLALRVAVATVEGLGADHRQLRHPGGIVALARGVHQHHADQRL